MPTFWLNGLEDIGVGENSSIFSSKQFDTDLTSDISKNGDWRNNLLTQLTKRNTNEHVNVDKLSVTYLNDVNRF